jgi:hypothetical protein
VIAVSLPVGKAWLRARQTKVAPSSWLEGVRNKVLSTDPVVPSFIKVWRLWVIRRMIHLSLRYTYANYVLDTLHVLFNLHNYPYEIHTTINPTVQMRKLRDRG